MVILDLIRNTAKIIGKRDAQLLIQYYFDFNTTDLFLKSNLEINDSICSEINNMVNRISNGEPIQYVTGHQEFMGLDFFVSPSVLIPRSDTEILVEKIIQNHKNEKLSILDIGCGSGCIGISLAHYIKKSIVTCLDISNKALDIAKSNALKNSVSIDFINCDILNEVPNYKFDIIVSNPPYIESNTILTLDNKVKDYEPHSALDGGADGLVFYRRICEIAPKLLNEHGKLYFEIGYNQGNEVTNIMKKSFSNTEITKDLCKLDRVVSGTLIS